MVLHIFNPEHDIALAYNRKHLTMPHAAQELRMNLGWIPAIWASDGDAVLVDDVKYAIKASGRFRNKVADVLFIGKSDIRDFLSCNDAEIQPWGWDLTLRTQLIEAGIHPEKLPSDSQLDFIRNLSSRVQTVKMTETLRCGLENETCGMSRLVDNAEVLSNILKQGQKLVLKAPWSSSGRGIRYADGESHCSLVGWYKRVIALQGGIMVEPYYRKIKDFGMEFTIDKDNRVRYLGMSLFDTINHAYVGNLLALEEEKEEIISKYISLSLIEEVKERICSYMPLLTNHCYTGPFGIDMMIVAKDSGDGFLLHPCVEINLRRTMGHVSLSIPHDGSIPNQVMSIVHDVNYALKISNVENNFVQTL